MKVKKIEIIEEKKFKPFAINIDIEKELDLVELWALFNQEKDTLFRAIDDKFKLEYAESFKVSKMNKGPKEIWDILNKKVIEYEMDNYGDEEDE